MRKTNYTKKKIETWLGKGVADISKRPVLEYVHNIELNGQPAAVTANGYVMHVALNRHYAGSKLPIWNDKLGKAPDFATVIPEKRELWGIFDADKLRDMLGILNTSYVRLSQRENHIRISANYKKEYLAIVRFEHKREYTPAGIETLHFNRRFVLDAISLYSRKGTNVALFLHSAPDYNDQLKPRSLVIQEAHKTRHAPETTEFSVIMLTSKGA